MNNTEVLQDFRRRYEGTYVHVELHSKEKEVLAYVRAVEQSDSKIGVLHLDTEEYGTLQLNFGSDDHTLKFKYPPVGVFQHGAVSALFFRLPRRQYRRGICSDNSMILATTRLFGGPANPGVTRASVQSAFNHRVYDVQNAIAGLTAKMFRSVALADNLTLTQSPFEDSSLGLVLHYQQPIATFNLKTGKLERVYEKIYAGMLNRIFLV